MLFLWRLVEHMRKVLPLMMINHSFQKKFTGRENHRIPKTYFLFLSLNPSLSLSVNRSIIAFSLSLSVCLSDLILMDLTSENDWNPHKTLVDFLRAKSSLCPAQILSDSFQWLFSNKTAYETSREISGMGTMYKLMYLQASWRHLC